LEKIKCLIFELIDSGVLIGSIRLIHHSTLLKKLAENKISEEMNDIDVVLRELERKGEIYTYITGWIRRTNPLEAEIRQW